MTFSFFGDRIRGIKSIHIIGGLDMNKWRIRGVLLIGYGVPFAFLSMYGDVAYGTMLLYAFMIAALSMLCFRVIKSKQFMVVIPGNILSFLTSYLCIQQFYTDKWGWYLKPFTANGLLIAISGIAVLIQLLFVSSSYRKQRTK